MLVAALADAPLGRGRLSASPFYSPSSAAQYRSLEVTVVLRRG
ncbi:MAG: hypothetical protein ACYCUG_11535 [Acidimicrobiales bacterium]